MSRNLESLTKLTEFEPIQTDERPQTVSQFFANLFKRGKNNAESDKDSIGEFSIDPVQESLPNWAIDSETASIQSDNVSNVYTVDVSEGRSLPNVLKRISNLLVLKSNAYSDSELKTYWMPDSVSKECYECCEKFTTFRRRHHCRVCGQIFCSSCCNQQIPGKIFGCTGDLRVCTYCSKVVLSYLQSSDISTDLTSDLKVLQENLQSKYGPLASDQQSSINVHENTLSQSNLKANSGDSTGTIKRKISVGYQEEKFSAGRQPNVTYLTPQEKCKALQNSSSLRNLYEELLKPSGNGGLPLRSHWYRLRAYHDCVLGSEVVDWLINQQKANTRVQASAICQALLDGGYLDSLSELETFTDGYAFYKPGVVLSPEPITETEPVETVNPDEPSWIQNIPQESTSTTDSDNEPLSLRLQSRVPSSTSYTLDLNVGSSTVYICRPPNVHEAATPQSESDCENERTSTVPMCSDTFVRTSEHREIVPESGWHNATNLRKENSERAIYDILTNTFKQHKESLLQQLLSVNGLSLHWSSVISILCDDAINVVRPDMNHDAVELDIRHYIQFKKIPGGKRSDCQLIQGVVCSKNIAHKGMATFLDNPKILLLEGSIVYQRTEGRLTSLEPVLMQEHEYLRHVANRIIALQPDLVLVQRNVSRLAQDILRDQGVTLVLNVKQRILERVARCTEADIVTSVDSCIGRPRLGTCKCFYLKSFETERCCVKNLMMFEGLAMPHLGATVLLRGASRNELIRLKKVAALLLFACYNWRLEKSYLMDEMARPPNFRTDFFSDSRETSPVQYIGASDDKGLKLSPENLRKQEPTTSESDTSLFTLKTLNEMDEMKAAPKVYTADNPDKKIVCSEAVQDFSDPLQSSTENVEVTSTKDNKISFAELPFTNRFREALDDTILSVSPYLLYTIPYLETESGRKCALRNFFPVQIYHSEQFDNNRRVKSFKESAEHVDIHKFSTNNNNTQLKPVHPFVTVQIGMNVNSGEIQTMLAHYRACGGRFVRKSMIKNSSVAANRNEGELVKGKVKGSKGSCDVALVDVLNMSNHQRLAVLFCSFSQQSTNAPAFCVNPWVIYMDFYNRDDIPLGCFLERYCFNSLYHCQSRGCDTPMLHHIRRFVHGNGCVSLSLNTYPTKIAVAMDDRQRIVMWTWCTRCQLAGPIVPMSTDTWSFSFAKYLQLRFIGGAYSRRGSAQCVHSLHHDQYQYFGFNDTVACFTYTPTQIWEISLPPPIISFNCNAAKMQSDLIDEIKSTAVKCHEIYSIVAEKISLLPEIEAVTNWKQILLKEQVAFKQRIEEVQLKLTSPTIEQRDFGGCDVNVSIWKISDHVVGIKQVIIDTVEKWNNRLQDMGKLREIELKKAKNQPLELESSIETATKPLLINLEHVAKEDASGLSKKIASLDQCSEDDVPSPRTHQRSSSDGTILTQLEEVVDMKKDDKKTNKTDKKNIFSQLLTSTTAFSPITCPYSLLGHFTLPPGIHAPIVVYETELSSMIAYALNSNEYVNALDDLRLLNAPVAVNSFAASTSSPNAMQEESSPSPVHKRRSQSDGKDSTGVDSGILYFLRATNDPRTTMNSSMSSESSQATIGSEPDVNTVNVKEVNNKNDDKESTKKLQINHVDIQFEDISCKFFCRVYCPEQFAKLRKNNLRVSEENYIRSLARCFQWNARGGKSGSTFSKTLDERFILKDMSKSDINLFLEWAPNYFAYMDRCHSTGQPTLLGKILGMYHLIFKNSSTNATLRTNVLVMENLFYNRDVSQKFDLKGSERNRLVNPDTQDGEIVLLDENFLKRTCESPLYILPHSKAVLIAAIQNDTEFLVEQSVMDYSLLVGLDTDNKELVLGIIDYIRTFTWDKKLETMFKKYGMLGGQGKLPTIISPQEYRNRFIEAMHRYFLQVPDSWSGLGKGLEN